ncbi:activity-regulated cytoskeleton associated protein 2-like [Ctenocephalides felis]|uniref:activity-regulated cytoskeleton associated protein 2-like n=1 Tax=Ctenocephalides felis TaxID=7515 RepID=UPI000E6E2ABC|nr:activity-regulated cytoskeleton associated protein 2-like [Ctenocephalides felis]
MSLTEEQLQRILSAVVQVNTVQQPTTQPQKSGSFANCDTRFNGSRDPAQVDHFLTRVATYKEIEGISDKNALKGLPLLLTNTAALWWKGNKSKQKTGNTRLNYYKKHSHRRRRHTRLTWKYLKNVLLAALPPPIHTEEQQIDMIYELLNIRFRERIPRDSFETFEELQRKAREVEQNMHEASVMKPKSNSTYSNQCTFYNRRGHMATECRKMAKAQKNPPRNASNLLRCYSCGKSGVIRSICPVCNPVKPAKDTEDIQICILDVQEKKKKQDGPMKGRRKRQPKEYRTQAEGY